MFINDKLLFNSTDYAEKHDQIINEMLEKFPKTFNVHIGSWFDQSSTDMNGEDFEFDMEKIYVSKF